jgi:hypothetical protein
VQLHRRTERDDRQLSINPNRRARLPGSEHATVTRDDAAIAAGEDWLDETEFLDGGRDLRDLGITMRAGVTRVRNQLFEGPEFDGARH